MKNIFKNLCKPGWFITLIFCPIVVGIIILLVGQKLNIGELYIRCNVDSAKIFVNSEYHGLTSKDNFVSVGKFKSGSYTIEVKKPGFTPSSIPKVQITKGEITTIEVELTPRSINTEEIPPPIDKVNSTRNEKETDKEEIPRRKHNVSIMFPEEFNQAEVFVDDFFIGNGSKTYKITEGRHKLKIKARTEKGTYIYSDTISVTMEKKIFVQENEFKLIKKYTQE